MSKFMIKMLVVAVLAGLVSGNVMAQHSKEDDPFRFSISLSSEFTDNRDSDAAKQSNIDTFIGPKFEIHSRPADASRMMIYYNPTFRFRAQPSDVQNEGEVYHNAKFELRKKSSQIAETRIIDFFNYTDDPAVTQNGTLLRRDSSYIYNYLEAGMHRKVQGGQNTVDLYGSYSMKAYDETSVAEQSDEDTYAVNLLYLKQHHRRSAIAFECELSGVSYKELVGADRSFMAARGSIGLEHISSPSLRFGARVGGQIVSYADEALGTEVAPAFNLSMTGNTIPTVAFTVSLDHMVRESDVFPFASQTATDLRGELEWTLTEKSLAFSGAATYHVGDYAQEALPGSSIASGVGKEDSVVLEGKATYTHSDAVQFGLSVRTEDVSADSPVSYGRDFTRNSIAASITRKF